jgi:hypothetical protein
VTSPVLPYGQQSRSMAEQTAQRTEAPTDLRMGTVTAVTAYGITCSVAGGSVTASHLDSYSPAVGHTVVLQRVLDAWVCLGRPVGSGTAKDGGSAGSGMGLTVLAGVDMTGSGALASSSGSEVPVPGMSLTFYHPAGHPVLLIAGFAWQSTNAADWLITRFRNQGGSVVGEFSEPVVSTSFGRYSTHTVMLPASYGGGQRQYYLNLIRITGTGTTTISRNPANQSYMLALDVGDQTLVKAA